MCLQIKNSARVKAAAKENLQYILVPMQTHGLQERSEVGDIEVARRGGHKMVRENWVDIGRPKKGGGYKVRQKAKKPRGTLNVFLLQKQQE